MLKKFPLILLIVLFLSLLFVQTSYSKMGFRFGIGVTIPASSTMYEIDSGTTYLAGDFGLYYIFDKGHSLGLEVCINFLDIQVHLAYKYEFYQALDKLKWFVPGVFVSTGYDFMASLEAGWGLKGGFLFAFAPPNAHIRVGLRTMISISFSRVELYDNIMENRFLLSFPILIYFTIGW